MEYDNEIGVTLRTLIYYPKHRESVVQIVARRECLYLAQNSLNRFVILHAQGNYKYISFGYYMSDIITRIYGHGGSCLSMLSSNADRMKERNRNTDMYTHRIRTIVHALDSYSQYEEDDIFRSTKFEVFMFSCLTYANCNISSADYYWKEYMSLRRLRQWW